MEPVRISITDPVSQAFDWTGHVLFKPFDIGKWFVLGFCAWLAWLGQGGGGSFNWNTPRDDFTNRTEAAGDWVDAHLALVVVLVGVLALLMVGLILLLTWLTSRGKLMFLDGVVQNRGAVVEPWHRFKAQANSLFGFRVVVGLIALLVFGLLGALTVGSLIAMGIRDNEMTTGLIAALFLWGTVVTAVAVVFGLISVALNDVVVPIMWLRGCRVMEAWSEFRGLLAAHSGSFVLYVLMKILLGLGIVVISCLATCFTCCIAAIPYIGTVLLLPLFVFRRSYSIYFLSQFGPPYERLAPRIPEPEVAQS